MIVCPVSTTIGTESMCAVMMPVSVFVAPGPLVTSTTPGLPVARAYPSAMCVAPCSWRTRISLIFVRVVTSASKIGIAAPPESPKMYSTPSFSRHRISACPPSITSLSMLPPSSPPCIAPGHTVCTTTFNRPFEFPKTGSKNGPSPDVWQQNSASKEEKVRHV